MTYHVGIYRRAVGGHARRMARQLHAVNMVPQRRPVSRPIARNLLVINYGVGQRPMWEDEYNVTWLNDPDQVRLGSNKLTALRMLAEAGIPTLQFTTSQEDAEAWQEDGKVVFARTILNGSRGDGIVLVRPGAPPIAMPSARLYTCNFPKTHEYRIHVAGGRVIDMVEKKARSGVESHRTVRNHAGGWVFAHDNLSAEMEGLGRLAVCATNAVGLDFAGVDILAKLGPVRRDAMAPRPVVDAVVCELNSAPAWECTATKAAYKEYFRSVLSSRAD